MVFWLLLLKGPDGLRIDLNDLCSEINVLLKQGAISASFRH